MVSEEWGVGVRHIPPLRFCEVKPELAWSSVFFIPHVSQFAQIYFLCLIGYDEEFYFRWISLALIFTYSFSEEVGGRLLPSNQNF